MLNCAILMGRLTADPELRTTTGGISVTSFSIAVERAYKRDETDFINVVAWRQNAEFITRYFHKGSMIAIQGSIQTRNYEDKNGNKRTAFEVVADRASFCGSKAETGTSSEMPASRPAPAYQGGDADGFSVLPTGDDTDFPFGGGSDDGLPF